MNSPHTTEPAPRANQSFALLLAATFLLGGCITEPAPSEPHSYGSITQPKKPKRDKKQKPPKKHEDSVTVVQ